MRRTWYGWTQSFTLLEVVVAIAIFFTAIFAVLQLVSQNMSLARALQRKRPDLGTLAGRSLMDTNWSLGGREAPMDSDFESNPGGSAGSLFRRSRWERNALLIAPNISQTNGLYRVDLWLTEDLANHQVPSQMSILIYRPLGLEVPP
ncbi:MAG: hypothetical protein EXS22_05360 [Pedosphaera sp.]|nr:hypothetical protein [Pedosphaera sp.]